jgi:hypothetical protein
VIKGMRAFALCSVVALLAAAPVQAQGKGNENKGGKGNDQAKQHDAGKQQGRGKGNDKGQAVAKGNAGKSGNDHRDDDKGRGQGKGNDDNAKSHGGNASNGNASTSKGSRNFKHDLRVDDFKPNVKRFATSNRAPHKIAAGALGRGFARGLGDDDVVIRENGDRVLLLNRSGTVLVDLNDERARNLGNWRVRPYDDDVKSGAPAFCRSGEGHPVWGREWCLDKGFGLGDYRDLRWGRTTDVGDIIFRQEVDRATLARDVLIGVLGDVVLNRLGLHALTLGYADPLTGVWLGEPTGPRVLRLSSGAYPIAEIYDGNRDNRADALVVALRPW